MIFGLQFSSINFMFELIEKLILFRQPESASLTAMFIWDRLTAMTNSHLWQCPEVPLL